MEFADKHIARRVALSLNGTIVGGRKRSFHYNDLWCIKYLPRFRWSHLMEHMAYEKAVREQRVRAELTQARRESKAYLESMDRAKMLQSLEQRHAARRAGAALESPAALRESAAAPASDEAADATRRFRQRPTLPDPETRAVGRKTAALLPRLLQRT